MAEGYAKKKFFVVRKVGERMKRGGFVEVRAECDSATGE